MFNHTPESYICPICLAVKGIESNETLIRQSDMVYNDDLTSAFVSSFFIGNNPGHIIIVPNEHFENIYDLPEEFATRISQVTKKISIAVRNSYEAEGITILQNNEPAGDQHAFHYHLHVFPRYTNDALHSNMNQKKDTTLEQRLVYAEKVKKLLE